MMDERKKGEMKDFHYVMSFNDNVCAHFPVSQR